MFYLKGDGGLGM